VGIDGSEGIVGWHQILLGGVDKVWEETGVGELCVDIRFC